MRQRDDRFADRTHHTDKPDPLHDKRTQPVKTSLHTASEFVVNAEQTQALCPAGKSSIAMAGIARSENTLR